ncbi:MAG TPA: hypothetical protein VLH10_21255 [Yinghuangia sp.]|nr:hypothetical protein [Yinghuangia sp.]
MRTQLARIAVALGLALGAVILLVGGVPDTRTDEPEHVATSVAAAADPYPLAEGPTADEVQLVVFERAYSECASADLGLLASKYKAAKRSGREVATAVGRAWASYFGAGADAVRDGREGCLQGQAEREGR